MKKKFLIYSVLTFLILLTFTLSQNIFNIKKNLSTALKNKYPNIGLLKNYSFAKDSVILNLKNDYNVKFLPETQFRDLNLIKKKIIFDNKFETKHKKSGWPLRTFYLDNYEQNIIIVNYLGDVYFIDKNELLNEKNNNINPKKIASNINPKKVLDIKINEKKIYISYVYEINDCQSLKISVANLNFQILEFKDFYSYQLRECGNNKSRVQAGRIIPYNYKGENGILFSTYLEGEFPEGKNDLFFPQKDTSLFGKILFFNLETKKPIIFSKGHGNIQGLYVEDNIILSTEHGPRGGDEINNIKFNKNYGWPIASYGEKYFSDRTYSKKDHSFYKKDHASYGFEEPIYAYVPSIAISEIIRLPNEFSKSFQDNFIVTTLANKHIHRVKFDKNFDKLIFDERIFINERIRDIVYIEGNNLILMAFEEKGELGILSNTGE